MLILSCFTSVHLANSVFGTNKISSTLMIAKVSVFFCERRQLCYFLCEYPKHDFQIFSFLFSFILYLYGAQNQSYFYFLSYYVFEAVYLFTMQCQSQKGKIKAKKVDNYSVRNAQNQRITFFCKSVCYLITLVSKVVSHLF